MSIRLPADGMNMRTLVFERRSLNAFSWGAFDVFCHLFRRVLDTVRRRVRGVRQRSSAGILRIQYTFVLGGRM